jgi:hypothetical protein
MRPIRLFLILLLLFLSADLALGQRARQRYYSQQLSFSGSSRLNADWRPGLINIPEVGYGYGLGGTMSPMSEMEISVTNVTGYQFNRNIKAGIGYGVQRYSDGMLIPFFFDTRISMSARSVVPFVSSSIGAAFSPEDFERYTRIFANPAIGFRFVFMRNLTASLSTGLLVHGGRQSRASFMNVRLGLEFKGSRKQF